MSALGNKDIFAKNLSVYVERSGKTQKEIAEILDVSPASFNNWIKGVKYPRIDKIERLANYFGILKSDLIEEKEKTMTNSHGLSDSKKQLIALAENCSEEDAKKLLQMMRILVEKK